ncbi:vicilin-like seed storage protein At2g18540 [Xyrichtys novacula]|uniref:Vicilin-like seed storage protein At2g18540 n=1 Tax=Xyrichtys novacula TaxID=13765 RepID=A0AAV1F7Y8_XYRNO|nr:vicilin-like seed storage protein At2g18540 [Xyrichtys novacula]
MFAKQYSSLIAEMERVKSLTKLTPEERKEEEEALEKPQKEREERERKEERTRKQREKHQEEKRIQEVKQRAEEKRKTYELKALQEAEQEQLKQERLHYKKVIQVKEKPGKRPRCTIEDLKEEQKAELCGPLREVIPEDPVIFHRSDATWIAVQGSNKSDEDTTGDN